MDSPQSKFETPAESALTGLSAAQVEEQKRLGRQNLAVDPPSKTVGQIIAGNVFTYFNLIFAVLATLLILVGSFRELTFLPVIIANTLIGIVQEVRSKKTLDKLSVLNAPHAQVIRGGEKRKVPAEELVLGDLVEFSAGNQIPADAQVVRGEVQVNESLLTGEADEITKGSGAELMSGSFVVSGTCLARLIRVGADSYVSKLTLEAKAQKKGQQSEMMRSLDKLIKIVGFVIIPIGGVMFWEHYFRLGESLQGSVNSVVAALIGMIPEGLYLLASVALAVSVIRLAKKRVLVHDLSCIETLARVDVLCVDKTGTITENTMQVSEVVPLEGNDLHKVEQIAADLVAAQAADNATMAALKAYFNRPGGGKAQKVVPFSSATKYSAAVFSGGAYVLGAPEFVLRELYGEYQEIIEDYSKKGCRVLALCSYPGEPGGPLTLPAEPLGLILLENPIRQNAAETFGYFTQQGVAIKVISGDNPVTVSQVALAAGIPDAENFVDAQTLTTPELLSEAAGRYTVFGRVTPNQKRELVTALKKAGKTVAMTGDGVNDVLALKQADCSVAMASGSDAAAHASQLVLLDSDFSCMPSVVLEGRRVVNNIQRSSCLFLVKNIFSLLMALFSMIFFVNYPLQPSQISLVSMFTIGIPAFFLALEPNKSIIKGNFLANVLLGALPAGLTNFLVIGALVMFGQVFGVDPVDISTASTFLLIIVGLMILYRISRPMNILRWTVWVAMLVGVVFCSLFLNNLFSVYAVSLKCGLLLAVFAIVTEPVLRYLSLLFEKLTALPAFLKQKAKKIKDDYEKTIA